MNDVFENSSAEWISIDQFSQATEGVLLLRGKWLRKKYYIFLDYRQAHRSITANFERGPLEFKIEGIISSRLRKLAQNHCVKEIFECKTSGTLLAPIYHRQSHSMDFLLRITNTKPPVLDLIDFNLKLSLCRASTQGQFSKSKELEDMGDFANNGRWTKTNLIPDPKQIKALPLDSNPSPEAPDAHTKELGARQRELAHKLHRKLKTAKKSLQKAQAHLPTNDTLDLAKTQADFVKSHASDWHDMDESASDEARKYEIDTDLPIGIALEESFGRIRKMRSAIAIQGEHFKNATQRIAELESDIARLRSNEVLEFQEFKKIADRHEVALSDQHGSDSAISNKSTSGKKHHAPILGRCFVIDGAYDVIVSRSSEEADLILKSARGNDFWFHAVQGTGSHVIVPYTNAFQSGLPPNLKRAAMILAAYYSDHTKNFGAEIYTATRHEIRKKKNMPAGLWLIDRASSEWVRYTEEELKDVLASRHKAHQ